MPTDRLLETWKRWTRQKPSGPRTPAHARAKLARVCVETACRVFRNATRGGLRAPGQALFTVHHGGTRFQTWRIENAVFVNFFEPGSDELSATPSSARVLRDLPELRQLLTQPAFKDALMADVRALLAERGLSVAMFVESPAHPEALGAVVRDNRISRGRAMWSGVVSAPGLARA